MMFIPSAGLLGAAAAAVRRNGQKNSEEKLERRQDPMGRCEAMLNTIDVQKKIMEMQKAEIGVYQAFLRELGAEITEAWEKSDRPIISSIDGKFREYTPKIVKVCLCKELAVDSPNLFDELSRLDKRLNEIEEEL